VAWSGHVTH